MYLREDLQRRIEKLYTEIATGRIQRVPAPECKPAPDGNFETLLSTPIESYCLMEMGDYQRARQMLMSQYQRDITLQVIGSNAIDKTNRVSDETMRYDYSYTKDNNYLDEFQRGAKHTTTEVRIHDPNSFNYKNYGQLYGERVNVYPDDNDSGNDGFYIFEKSEFYEPNRNRNSILKKTKDMFKMRKINTLISRFHTDIDQLDLNDQTQSASSIYGLSHGRNLLTYDAERNGLSYSRNGYDNPYCRVWTHHHQYDKYRSHLMRPFTVETDETGMVTKNQDFHKWSNFPDMLNMQEYEEQIVRQDLVISSDDSDDYRYLQSDLEKGFAIAKKRRNKWGWKDSGAEGWEYSVLNKNTGTLNIAPKFLGGADKNIHPKDCMFSIENLAWKGYDPYSFETALSWEQRGPFGGRIMWFPPYGLRFNEDTSVSWNEHTFIGRGENVFTYTNTSRSGTLEFMMVVDHPSILDYATWHNDKPDDTDILRFFAGCEDGSTANSLKSKVKPTPLTDEYTRTNISDAQAEKILDIPRPDNSKGNEIVFYGFFPNNYSGYFDRTNKIVDPVAYLLFGTGAQQQSKGANKSSWGALNVDFSSSAKNYYGNGYEMKGSKSDKSAQDDSYNFIYGTDVNLNVVASRKWYYRIDGNYTKPDTEKNCYSQILAKPDSYLDKQSFNLNYDASQILNAFSEETNKDNLYSLAEVAYVLCSDADKKRIIANTGWGEEATWDSTRKQRIETLKSFFNGNEITEITATGYSNAHGANASKAVNDKRNVFLAKERANTLSSWLKTMVKSNATTNIDYTPSKPIQPDAKGNNDESCQSAKIWRSARVRVTFKNSVQELAGSGGETNTDAFTITKEQYDFLSTEEKEKYQVTGYTLICKNQNIKTDINISVEEWNNLSPEMQACYKPSNYYRLKQDYIDELSDEQQPTYGRLSDFQYVKTENGYNFYFKNGDYSADTEGKRRLWFLDTTASPSEMKLWKPEYEYRMRSKAGWTSTYSKGNIVDSEYNSLRYDQEYYFFKQLELKHPDVFSSLVEKLQYFDPGFHSMTPEGFMGRLNFLHQCTRQGDTHGASDKDGFSANNLAFGRPPFCVLRLGDFYYQKIVIRNINITYDPLVLDLNNEGVGVVPLIANVSISFNFIGGGDLTGPVRRLQNAMSFNYYANGRLYDNRADRIMYEGARKNWDTMNNGKIAESESYFHRVGIDSDNL